MKAIREMLRSKKAVATISGIVVVLLTELLGVEGEIALAIAGLVATYVLGQGLADAGKEALKVTTEAEAAMSAADEASAGRPGPTVLGRTD